MQACECVCVRVSMRACERVSVRVSVRASVCACERACVHEGVLQTIYSLFLHRLEVAEDRASLLRLLPQERLQVAFDRTPTKT